MRLLVLGSGYSGTAIAKTLMPQAQAVMGTARSQGKLSALSRQGIAPFLYDGETPSPELRAAMQSVTHLVQSIAPGALGDPLLRAGVAPVHHLMPKLEWVGYLSTVGVYGDHGGGWVNEDTAIHPVSVRSRERVEAEQGWQNIGLSLRVPVAILRLSGIYGPGRNAFRNLRDGTARRMIKPDQVFNRIRVEDIAAVTEFLAMRNLGGIYNVTDDEPAPPQDVVTEAARLMGVAPPPETAFETAELSPMARSFYGENKRVSNRRLRDLGFQFRFPDYRISLADLWERDIWREA